uniref:AlNc14C448G11711 protein n=1 Tax=Albugo laibachii Nc14 TaxID=890382 RepID=F0WZW9_9STRA|nr:AlNc14C448G11711 [Albugo laibachii Nc14]|eukprot:CCA27049.1 AlNc14C448G11711 [Albugo laibachii Nc14]
MHLLPETVGSQHLEYLQKKVGNFGNYYSNLVSGQVTNDLWPPTVVVLAGTSAFDERAIVLVEFEAGSAKHCIKCMVLRSEVFFVYVRQETRYGYFWMTQNHKSIIGYSLENSCQEIGLRNIRITFLSDIVVYDSFLLLTLTPIY